MIGERYEGKKVVVSGNLRIVREEGPTSEKLGGGLSRGTRIREVCEAAMENIG